MEPFRADPCITSSGAWDPSGSHWLFFFAGSLILTSFLTGNGIQANTVADVLFTEFSIPAWMTGLVSSSIVLLVIVGGIARIGRVTSILAPMMAALYVFSALLILIFNYDQIIPTLELVFKEAFQPSAGVAGTGAGFFVTTMMWGVRRGLFSNEAGQGSAPIAHSTAKTAEPVSEGVVALLEPLVDTLVVCSMTGLVILITGVWQERIPTAFDLSSGDISYVTVADGRTMLNVPTPTRILVRAGRQATGPEFPRLAWHDIHVDQLFLDSRHTGGFTGVIYPLKGVAISEDGRSLHRLYGYGLQTRDHSVGVLGELLSCAFRLIVCRLDGDLLELLRRPVRQLSLWSQGNSVLQNDLCADAFSGGGLRPLHCVDSGRCGFGIGDVPQPCCSDPAGRCDGKIDEMLFSKEALADSTTTSMTVCTAPANLRKTG